MNIYEICYSAVAKRYNTDLDGAKEIVAKYLKDLKKEIDESDDENTKTRWYEDFGDTLILTRIGMFSLHFLLVIIHIYQKNSIKHISLSLWHNKYKLELLE